MEIISKKNLNILNELDDLSLSLNKIHYASDEKIFFYSQKLAILIKKINEHLLVSDLFSKDFLEQQLSKAVSLIGRCDSLKIDHAVVQLAQKAQKLSHANHSFINKKLKLIEKKISLLKKNHALTSENRKIIRFTEILIQSFHTKTTINQQEIDQLFQPIDTESAFLLLEIAEHLFKTKLHLAREQFSSVNLNIQIKLKEELKKHGVRENEIFSNENIIKVVQVIIGFCDQLSLLQKEAKLPSYEEIKVLFSEEED